MRAKEFLKVNEAGVGKIVKNVNTTADVQPGEIQRQAAKLGMTIDKDGEPPTISTSGKETKQDDGKN